MIDISVIVPAYNVEKYISSCLDSLLNQTKKEIEIIAIDDGSTDNTLNILNEYKRNNPSKIHVISQNNQGLSITRNNGIKLSTGKYISFVDGDDEIDTNLFKNLWDKLEEFPYDVVAFNVEIIYPNKKIIVNPGITSDIKDFNLDSKKKFLTDMYCMACNKIYKRDLFKDADLLFTPNTWFEDVLLMHKLIPNLTSLGYLDFPGYKYYQRENSITYTYSDKLKDINFVLEKILEYYKKNNLYSIYKAELEYIYARYMFATYIKRLAKSKDRQKFNNGIKYSLNCVNKTFPNYKKNIYINKSGLKNLYLKNFNKFLAKIIYYLEKNKMN